MDKNIIFGRIHRKSYHVLTLGKESPYNAFDDPLVETINHWLSEGRSVTRDMGLEVANSLLKVHKLKHKIDNEILLDARWWASFIDRNKRRLTCSLGDE